MILRVAAVHAGNIAAVARQVPASTPFSRKFASRAAGRIALLRRPLSDRARKQQQPTSSLDAAAGQARTLRTVVVTSLGGVLGLSYFYGRTTDDGNEKVWVGSRSPYSLDRAYSAGPCCACIGSGIIATLVAKVAPASVALVQIPGGLHELMAVPLTILLAFRFQGSYDRWWGSRREIEAVATSVIGIALCAANSSDSNAARVKALRLYTSMREEGPLVPLNYKEQAKVADQHTCFLRMLSLLDVFCSITDTALMCGEHPHASNEPSHWPSMGEFLSREDSRRLGAAADPLLWSLDAMMECIHTGQQLGMYSSELSSEMFAQVNGLHLSLRQCEMVVKQSSPAPFVVHMRTMLLAYCFTYPLSIIGSVPAFLLLPCQVMVSFSLLGIEFCSREMEHPFGNDASDVPCRRIMSEARVAISRVRDRHT